MTEQDIAAVTPQVPSEVQSLVDRLKVITDNSGYMSPLYRDVMDIATEAINLLVKGEPFNPEPQEGSGQDGWKETARHESSGSNFWQGLVQQTGQMLGPDVYVCDDGTISSTVLGLKVPELVKKLVDENKQFKSSLKLNIPAPK